MVKTVQTEKLSIAKTSRCGKKDRKKSNLLFNGEPIDLQDMPRYSFDHIIPLSRGGESTLENMGLALKEANQAKSDLTKKNFWHYV
jgi:CRISPR/Cas system Type II protein with McrA/HNH and RuvC-like nuclease domain